MNEQHDPNAPEFVFDEMTGEQVRFDETIVFHGKRVGAEGKRILMEKIDAGERLPGELQAPGGVRRLCCMILDWIITAVAALPFSFALGYAAATSTSSHTGPVALSANPLELIPAVISFLYFGIGHAYFGRTVGKLAGRIKVVMQDGSPITRKAGWIRSFIFAGLGLPLIPLYFIGDTGFWIAAIANIAISLFLLANAITVLVDPQKRAIHDMIAGTRVIEID